MMLKSEQVKALVNIIDRYTGFNFPSGLEADFLSHLENGLDHLKQTPEELINLVNRFSFDSQKVLELIQPLLDELLIGETFFWRDYEAYELLAKEVLPELVRQFGTFKHSLRIWSAGCSSGEEVYSLSIFLNKYLANQGWQIFVTGSDLNKNKLEKARNAVYGPNSFRQQTRFSDAFTAVDGKGAFRVKEAYKRNVQFSWFNLVEDRSQSLNNNFFLYDIIFCRNVLIYFKPETRIEVVKRLYQALNPGGFLVITPSEYSKVLFEDFEVIDKVNYRILRRPLQLNNGNSTRQLISPSLVQIAQEVTPPSPTVTSHKESEIDHLEGMLVKDRLNPAFYLTLIAFYQEQHSLHKALEMARKYVYLEPNKPEGYFYLINLEAQAGNKQCQARAYNRIISILEHSDPAERNPNLSNLSYGELLQLVRSREKEIMC